MGGREGETGNADVREVPSRTDAAGSGAPNDDASRPDAPIPEADPRTSWPLSGARLCYSRPGLPLAPAILAPILGVPTTDPVAREFGASLDRFDLELTERLAPALIVIVGDQIAVVVKREIGALRDVRPLAGQNWKFPLEALGLSVATYNRLARFSLPVLREATIGDLMWIPNFGIRSLLEYLVVVERATAGQAGGRSSEIGRVGAKPKPSTRLSAHTRRELRAKERAAELYELRISGLNWQQVADRVGLSRERVRNMVLEAGYSIEEAGQRSTEAREARRQARLDRQVEELSAEVDGLIESGMKWHQIVADLNLDSDLRDRLLERLDDGQRLRLRVSAAAVDGHKRFSDDELLYCLREAEATMPGRLSGAKYEAYAQGRQFADGRDWPRSHTYRLRFGNWCAAVQQAGLVSNHTSIGKRSRLRYDDRECVRAIDRVSQALGHLPTVAEYDRYVRSFSADGLPSAPTIRFRFGSWSAALNRTGYDLGGVLDLAAAAPEHDDDQPDDRDPEPWAHVPSSPPRDRHELRRQSRLARIAKARERGDALHRMRVSGMSLRQIGEQVGISGERVRQLIVQAGHPPEETKAQAKEARKARSDRHLEIQAAELRPQVHRLLDQGRSLKEIRTTLGVSAKAVELAVDGLDEYKRIKTALRRPARPIVRTFTEAEVIGCLRQAQADIGGMLSLPAYNAYGKTKRSPERPWPSSATVTNYFGSWRGGVIAAGLPANPGRGAPGCHQRYSEQDCLDVLHAAASTLGRMPSTGEYFIWREQRRREYAPTAASARKTFPTVITIRNRFGSWPAAVRRADET